MNKFTSGGMMNNVQIEYLNKVPKLFLPFVSLSVLYLLCSTHRENKANTDCSTENTKWAKVKQIQANLTNTNKYKYKSLLLFDAQSVYFLDTESKHAENTK